VKGAGLTQISMVKKESSVGRSSILCLNVDESTEHPFWGPCHQTIDQFVHSRSKQLWIGCQQGVMPCRRAHRHRCRIVLMQGCLRSTGFAISLQLGPTTDTGKSARRRERTWCLVSKPTIPLHRSMRKQFACDWGDGNCPAEIGPHRYPALWADRMGSAVRKGAIDRQRRLGSFSRWRSWICKDRRWKRRGSQMPSPRRLQAGRGVRLMSKSLRNQFRWTTQYNTTYVGSDPGIQRWSLQARESRGYI